MDKKPTFNPDLLNKETETESKDSEKVRWETDKDAIEAILEQQSVRLDMPKVYYSYEDPELQKLIPTNVEFIDELIAEYRVRHVDEKQVIITVVPKDAAPFHVQIEDGFPKADLALLGAYTRVTSKVPSEQKYAHEQISDLMSQNDQKAATKNELPYRVITDLDNAQAA